VKAVSPKRAGAKADAQSLFVPVNPPFVDERLITAVFSQVS